MQQKRRKRIQVKGGSQYHQRRPSRFVNHPANGTPKFCDFPSIGKIFCGGPVYLREGQHWGANRGYGVLHIWAEPLQKRN
jgi:hypothetical protein